MSIAPRLHQGSYLPTYVGVVTFSAIFRTLGRKKLAMFLKTFFQSKMMYFS
jgi:hypothetical protein